MQQVMAKFTVLLTAGFLKDTGLKALLEENVQPRNMELIIGDVSNLNLTRKIVFQEPGVIAAMLLQAAGGQVQSSNIY